MQTEIAPGTAGSTKPRVQSAARVVEILHLVARADSRGISASAISERLNIPRQVVYHLAHTLTSTGMLRKVGRGSYLLGLGAAVVAEGFRRQIETGDFVSDYAEKAAQSTGEAAYVVGWMDGEIVVMGTARGSGAIQAAEVPLGTAGNAHARASGKLILAMADEVDVERYLATHTLSKRTPNTITTRKALARELEHIRNQGFAVEREEYAIGLSCVAVPLGLPPSIMALGISAPLDRFEKNLESYLAALKNIASSLSS